MMVYSTRAALWTSLSTSERPSAWIDRNSSRLRMRWTALLEMPSFLAASASLSPNMALFSTLATSAIRARDLPGPLLLVLRFRFGLFLRFFRMLLLYFQHVKPSTACEFALLKAGQLTLK